MELDDKSSVCETEVIRSESTNEVTPSSTPCGVREKFFSDTHAHDCLSHMKSMYESSKLTDVTLVAGDLNIPAHRLVLSSASDYFHAMFTSELKESMSSEIKMEGVDAHALKQIIDYCYGGEITLEEETVETLLCTANMLQIHNVVTACCQFLTERLHPSNSLGIRMFSETQGCVDLHNAAQAYILDHFVDVALHQEFLLLPAEEVEKLVSSEDINVPNEEVVFNALMSWLNYNIGERRQYLARLLALVKLPLLSPLFIADRVNSNPLFGGDQQCFDLIIEACSYHLVPERRAMLRSPRVRPRKSTVGDLLMIGGMDGYKGSLYIDKYDLRTNSWSQFGMMSGRRLQFGAAIIGDKLFVVGGRDGLKTLNSVECFDTKTKVWNALPPMATHRHGLGVGVLGGPMYAVGGHDGWSYLSTVERWDPCTMQWSFVAPMNTQRSTCGVAVLNNKLYAVGGRDGSSCLRSVECYDPLTNKWTLCAPMAKRRGGAGVAVVNGYLYAFGGHDAPILNPEVSRFDCVERYDPQTGQWAEVACMSVGRDAIGVCVLGNKVIAIGGYNGNSYLTVVESYDPQTNEWTPIAPLSCGRAGMCIVVLKK